MQTLYAYRVRPHLTRRRVMQLAIIGAIVLIAIPLVTYAYYARDIGNRERLMNRNNTGLVLKDRSGTVFYSSGVRSSTDNVPLSAISDDVEKAAVASEDKDFYHHHGFSVRGTGRAMLDNLLHHNASRAGGSTITQQLVKNKLLGSQKNYLRKYQEVAMAVAVERAYDKNDILDMYLNSAYFGDGAFGIDDAAHTYFAKSAANLNLAESSMLVGLLPAPTAYSPVTGDKALAKRMQANVLRKMVATGKITSQQQQAALNTQLSYSNDAKKGGALYAQHFADMVTDELNKKYGEERVKRSGFTVTTTLDLSMQKTAEQIIKEQVALTTSRGGKNAGLVSIDPKNGQVRALVGSVDYYNKDFGQVNMATALRQPGSSFKPIYYSDAIDRGLVTAATILDDKPTTFGGTYSPHNYDNSYKGKMAVRNALAESRNIPAVQVMQKEGVSNAVKAANRMGITTVNDPNKYGLSLALGTAEVQLLQSTSAYTSFANQGQHYSPVLFTSVTDKYGKTILKPQSPKASKVLSPEAAYIIDSILSDTSARAPTYGTSLNISGHTVALKTGTTNDSRDAWTIGFTPSIVTGVWLGNNENKPMIGLAGGSGAGAIWKRVMTSYLHGKANENFTKPNDIVTIGVCIGTELRADSNSGSGIRTEYFKPGTEPQGSCKGKAKPQEDNAKKQDNTDEQPKNDNKPDNSNGQGNGDGTTTTPTDTTQPAPTDPNSGGSTGSGGTGTGTGGGTTQPTSP